MAIKHSGAHVLLTHLINVGVLTNPATNRPWPGFLGSVPNLPNNIVTVYNTAGVGDGREMPTGRTVEHPGFNLRIRASDELTGMGKGLELSQALDQIKNAKVTVLGKLYILHATRKTTPVIPIGEAEGGGRLLFTVNGTITYSEGV